MNLCHHVACIVHVVVKCRAAWTAPGSGKRRCVLMLHEVNDVFALDLRSLGSGYMWCGKP